MWENNKGSWGQSRTYGGDWDMTSYYNTKTMLSRHMWTSICESWDKKWRYSWNIKFFCISNSVCPNKYIFSLHCILMFFNVINLLPTLTLLKVFILVYIKQVFKPYWLSLKAMNLVFFIFLVCMCAQLYVCAQYDSVWPYGLQPARLLCPWDSLRRNTGVCCHALLQGTFPTQGSNSCLLRLPGLAGGFFTTSATWETPFISYML